MFRMDEVSFWAVTMKQLSSKIPTTNQSFAREHSINGSLGAPCYGILPRKARIARKEADTVWPNPADECASYHQFFDS
jgi:hypothetical protein